MEIKLTVLNEEEIKRIFEASIEVLSRTGTIIDDDLAVEMLHGAGARIEDSNRVFIPRELIDRAISSAPSSVTIFDRLGNKAMELGGHRSYFGAHVDCPNILDPDTGEKRRMMLKDIEKAARVSDALPNIDFLTSLDVVADVLPQYADAAAFATTVANTTKPIAFPLLSLETCEMIYEMASAVVGGHDQLRHKPFVIYTESPVAPLYHPKDIVRKTIFAAQKGLPYLYNPMPQGGLSAPTTMAGVLVVTLAEVLTGLLITQLVNPGTPYICGGVPSIFDMRDTTFVYGSPELLLMCAAYTNIINYYSLPVFGTAGVTNSKIMDLQAATDTALQTLMAGLSGSNMVHDIGLIDVGLINSIPMVVLTNEIIGMVRRIEKGIDITPETLALDVIDKVGPKGNFISEKHTVTHYKECWYPKIYDHSSRGSRVNEVYIQDRINKYIADILETHQPVEIPEKAKEIISSYANQWRLK